MVLHLISWCLTVGIWEQVREEEVCVWVCVYVCECVWERVCRWLSEWVSVCVWVNVNVNVCVVWYNTTKHNITYHTSFFPSFLHSFFPSYFYLVSGYFTGKVGSAGVDPMAQKIAQTAQLVEMNLRWTMSYCVLSYCSVLSVNSKSFIFGFKLNFSFLKKTKSDPNMKLSLFIERTRTQLYFLFFWAALSPFPLKYFSLSFLVPVLFPLTSSSFLFSFLLSSHFYLLLLLSFLLPHFSSTLTLYLIYSSPSSSFLLFPHPFPSKHPSTHLQHNRQWR